jgi:hypothetical protein
MVFQHQYIAGNYAVNKPETIPNYRLKLDSMTRPSTEQLQQQRNLSSTVR